MKHDPFLVVVNSELPKSPTPTPPNIQKRRKPTGIAWFDDAFSPVHGETGLWIAVITQALMDAQNRANNAEARYHKMEAIRWLTERNKDFTEVCLLAGMDPDYVRKKAKKALLSPMAWRAAPGQGKRYMERKAKRQRQQPITPKEPAPERGNVIIGPWTVREVSA